VVRNWKAGVFKPDSLRNGWMPPHPAFFVRREVYQRLGSFDERFRIAGDYDCILRFLKSGELKVSYLPEALINMRTGGASGRSLKNILIKSREDYQALKSNQVGGVATLLKKNLRKIPMLVFR
jgi:GT2 family glycosyltransferase